MTDNDPSRIIDVEIGRLNAAVREALRGLGVATDPEPCDGDSVIVIERSPDGGMTVVPAGASVTVSEEILSLCWSVVAGTSIVGRVSVRARRGMDGPGFVAIEAPT
jgi:hypothetical protein